MTTAQIKKYYSFAVKSGATIYGTDNICRAKRVYFVLASDELAQNAKDRLTRKAQRACCNIKILSANEFGQIESNPAIKAIGIKNQELAKAMQLNNGDLK